MIRSDLYPRSSRRDHLAVNLRGRPLRVRDFQRNQRQDRRPVSNQRSDALRGISNHLERKELIESYLGDISHGGKRRYYKITKLGKAYLKETVEEWNEIKEIVNIFMEGL